jgi:endonuclease/exonuclease/phosphatase family metal-dependent hydrolase
VKIRLYLDEDSIDQALVRTLRAHGVDVLTALEVGLIGRPDQVTYCLGGTSTIGRSVVRIATYNLWNSTFNWSQRLAAIVDELAFLDADIVAMQEAPTNATDTQSFVDFFREHTRYPHALHLEYPEEPEEGVRTEGLALLSKLPFTDAWVSWQDDRVTGNNWAVKVVVEWRGTSLGITNVHLDWEQEVSREQHVVHIVRELIDKRPCAYDILCGDFNDDVDSLVARFLEGQASIAACNTQWRDLAHEGHEAMGEAAPITLDFLGNPRWAGEKVDQAPARYDRIYLRSGAASRELRVLRAGLIGKEPANRSNVVPSDHYGVFVDLEEPAIRGDPRRRGNR